ncbi:teichuronic acid biosynthesis protein TuaE [Bacillus pumilus]|uniref:Sulfur relay protein TusE n=1 Tax=Bacillus pumilus (strain SAFR-032) TaxID=315750 RepID=A8FHZ3_BACP2|nr:O-antigen ligase family protein [Bacillus pumilus]ABV63860.1 sulfur relay protein TusE [Bacillus pumilus SAFR-032]AVI42527.1 O-antigen ligase domain-containing protein [Bacillus pumilus]MBC3641378.1 O-antigen ligase family protein [Bacillus pumilus]MBC3647006.1 O-antigen ligase family protein [Bacillus pumilus]MBC3648300.1 O-antigen ligase family protein [Bacillus pumilus]
MSVKQTAWQIMIGCILFAAGIGLVQMTSTQPVGLKKMVAVPVILLILAAALVLMKLYMNGEQIFMSAIYLLTTLTFLNNAFFSISAGFFSLFLYRIMLIAAFALFIWRMREKGTYISQWQQIRVKGILGFFSAWFLYGLISLLWAHSVTDGLKYMSLLAMGMGFVFLVVMYIQRMDQVVTFYSIWLVMTVFVMGIGFYNHFTLNHLPNTSLYLGPAYKQHYPTSVFFNQNDFATFLSISFFLYLACMRQMKNGYIKAFGLLGAIAALYLILLTESRASLLGIFAGVAIYVWLLLPRVLKKWSIIAASGLVVIGIAVFSAKIYSTFYDLFLASQIAHSFSEPLPSNIARANLMKNAWHFFTNSYGFGVGAGNVSYYLAHFSIFDTDQVVEVHNWLLELMTNFGFAVMLGYISLYAYLMFTLYKQYKWADTRSAKMIIEGLFAAMLSFLVSSISPSSISNLYFHWVFLGLVIAAVNMLKNKQRLKLW